VFRQRQDVRITLARHRIGLAHRNRRCHAGSGCGKRLADEVSAAFLALAEHRADAVAAEKVFRRLEQAPHCGPIAVHDVSFAVGVTRVGSNATGVEELNIIKRKYNDSTIYSG
jgi:hypothetical protein